MTDPATKYRDKVDPEHKMAMDAVAFAFQVLEPHAAQIDRFLEAERRAHSFLHITDPTLYRDLTQSDNFALQVRMANAARAFITEMEAVRDEARASGDREAAMPQPPAREAL